MTRAKHSLSIYSRADQPDPFADKLTAPAFIHRSELSDAATSAPIRKSDYTVLTLKDMFLDYAGRCPASAAIHAHIKRLDVGAKLTLKASGDHLLLTDFQDNCVARLSSAAEKRWSSQLDRVLEISVLALHTRLQNDVNEADYRQRIRTEQWEIPICEIKYLSSASAERLS
jgi:ATP-dependent DNA helicase RecQ